jgi:hypothetical protein
VCVLTVSSQVSACGSPSRQSLTDCYVVQEDVNNNSLCEAESWAQDTKDALPTAGQWLNDCHWNHKACNRGVDTDTGESWYPTRLIYLGDTDRDVRLINKAGKPPSGPYMTLSHRWGTALFTRLLKSNLDSFCDSISVTDLPEIFQEAIFASRQLGVRYLWIDSLCIIQDEDDPTDWAYEASLMSKVYSNSYCNLSASDTDEDSNTLFRHRDVRNLQPTHVRLCTTGFDKGADSVICRLIYNKFWEVNVSACPIQKRGWVYQERVLAPRIIHFGHNQLFWECREQRLCEQYPRGLPQTLSGYSNLKFKQFMDFERIGLELAPQDLYPDSLNQNDACFRIWASVVNGYSGTTLTNTTDKLIAISGIAKSFADVTGQTYVAGMWRESLEHALIWRNPDRAACEVNGTLLSQPTTWRAPSWSWASVDGPVQVWSNTSDHLLISVQDVVLTHATEDEMGLLTGGWLDLRGALKPMRISYYGDIRRADGRWRITELSMMNETFLKARKRLDLDSRYLGFPAFGDAKTEVDLFYMPASHYIDHKRLMADLLVLRVTDRQKLLFERVGLAFIDKLDQESLDDLLKNDTSEKKMESLPNLEYLEDDTHVIRIY